ncbi:MAG: glycine cleavage system aminomethyltransferase GcvT [Pseudomonadota bacterium]
MSEATDEPLSKTPLHDLHLKLGGKMVGFAGYSMPVQYPQGIVAEHKHTREFAGFFDVSHMGQVWLKGKDHAEISTQLEKLVPGDIANLGRGRLRYTQFTNVEGGILDDLMVTRPEEEAEEGNLFLVVNASRKKEDFELLMDGLGSSIEATMINDRALLALQGPAAESVLSSMSEGIEEMAFMSSRKLAVGGIDCWVSRSGYSGEDGFEISVKAEEADKLAELLLAHEDVMACGLGARDSLRLEAGLCLYGNDIDESTSPVEAGIAWSISKRRRSEGGFPGAERVQTELANGVIRKRVGVKPDGRAPARAGTEITDMAGAVIGKITSGGFGPSVECPVSMGYVPPEFSEIGTKVQLIVRGKPLPATIASLPFIPNNFKR